MKAIILPRQARDQQMQSRGKGRLLQAKVKLAAQATLLASSREQAQASAAERKAERDAAEVAAVLDWPLFVTLCVGFSLCLYPVASLSLLPLPLPLSPSLSLANCASSGSFVSLILSLNFVCCCAVCVVVLCAGLAIVSSRID